MKSYRGQIGRSEIHLGLAAGLHHIRVPGDRPVVSKALDVGKLDLVEAEGLARLTWLVHPSTVLGVPGCVIELRSQRWRRRAGA